MTAIIKDIDRLGRTDVAVLLACDVLALRIKRFVRLDAAQEIAERIASHWSLSAYRNTPELVRVGESHYETHDPNGTTNNEALQSYLDNADLLMEEIRKACSPHESPLDKLWSMLGEEFGVERARIAGREMFAGIGRVFPEGTELLPHNDSLARDAPGVPIGAELNGQLAANVYLRVPEQGGQLQLWEVRPSAEDLQAWRAPGSEYGTDRTLVPPPDLEIQIAPGDLVLIDATKLHGVARQIRGSRISLSCFLGIRRGRPMVCWS